MPTGIYKHRSLSPEHRRKIGEANKGRRHSLEAKRKMRDNNGSKRPEVRAKMSKAASLRIGKKSSHWKGGRTKAKRGYIQILCPSHPYANNRGYVLEHRLVMEAHIGRTLLPSEVVHHINGIVDDNRIENLMLFSNQAEHRRFHMEIG